MRQKIWKNSIKKLAVTMTAMTTVLAMIPQTVSADAVSEKPYLSLGADLDSEEKATVLELLGVKDEDLESYQVLTVTNNDEHDYLDSYLSQDVIGSRALSSVLIEKKDDGSGITVTTKNITYCTDHMYENALSTAGIEDANVIVAGPFDITGTAALVGAMKAYEDMTGEEIDDDTKDAATNELVVTGDLADDIGDSDKAEDFIAMLKEYCVEHDLTSDSDIEEAIDSCEEKLDIQLTDDQESQITDLMKKIDNLDLDVNQLKEQAKEIYNKLSSIEIDGQSFFDTILGWLNKLVDMFSK